jgi:Tfp pilus assembly protein PilV
MRKRWSSLIHDERGMALIMALGILLVLTIALTAVVQFSTSSARHGSRSNADERSYALAEAGVNAGVAVLEVSATPSTWPEYSTLTAAQRTVTDAGNTASWSATSAPCGLKCVDWTISARSSVRNPTGPSATAISRTVSKRFRVTWSGGFGFDSSFMYSFGDFTMTGGSVIFQEPIISDGNFSMGNGRVEASAVVMSVRKTITLSTGTSIGQGLATTLITAMDATQQKANVASVADFGTSGTTKIDSEWMSYTGTGTTAAACSPVPSPCLTGLTRGLVPGYPGAAHSTGVRVEVTRPATLTATMTDSQTVASVSSVTGYPSTCSGAGCTAGMIVVDDGPGGLASEYMTYLGTSTNSATCAPGPQPCFWGLSRGLIPGHPKRAHTGCTTACTPETADGRLAEIRSSTPPTGGCMGGAPYCTVIRSATPMSSSLLQDDPSFPKPVIDVAQARIDAAPGPNHLPGEPVATCPISFAAGAGGTNPYFNGATVNLTPTSNYTCTATSPTYGPGELSWNSSTKVLKVRGVVFLPSNVSTSQDLVYDAPTGDGATLYIGGDFDFSDDNVCGLRIVATTSCDTANWNPNVHGFVTFVLKNVPAWTNTVTGVVTPAQTGSAATNPRHQIKPSGGPTLQGVIYTDGLLDTSGGAAISGTVYAGEIKTSGNGSAPAPGILALPLSWAGPVTYTVAYVEGSSSG